MTKIDFHAPPASPALRTSYNLTIYRDTPLSTAQRLVTRAPRSSVRFLTPSSDRTSSGLFLGLIIMTLPAVVYSFIQAWQLCASGSLDHAIRAFAP